MALTCRFASLPNEAVALSFAEGLAAGLRALERIADFEGFGSHQPYHAALADLLRPRTGGPSR